MKKNIRQIDKRNKPPVKGIDLEHALNFIELEHVGEKFMYEQYTVRHISYTFGSRPVLEEKVQQHCGGMTDPLAKVQSLSEYVATEILWAGYYEHETRRRLPAGRNATEEEIIESGYGWCNEQARVLCALTQVAGVSSRLIFASNKAKTYGHVVCEVLLPEGWMLVDQSFAYCFVMNNKPVRAIDVFNNKDVRSFFEPIYKELCQKLIKKIGQEIVSVDFAMAAGINPLDGFSNIGFYNCFIH